MENQRKYEAVIKEKKGTCNETLFEKMAKNGDITATKVSELLGAEVTIVGYAECEITTEEKTFTINYFDTEEYGLISSGSEIFKKSVSNYYGEVEKVRITEVKTKKGKTYKAVPMLSSKKKEQTEKKEETENNDLPF
jgi:hypothetical protein